MEVLPSLEELVNNAEIAFEKQFGYLARFGASSPGRVNIIGEHIDYNDGFVFPAAMPMWTVIVGKPRADSILRIHTTVDVGSSNVFEGKLPPEGVSSLKPRTEPEFKWVNYVLGTIAQFPGGVTHGFDCTVVTSVPIGGGLSSSASLEAAVFTLLEVLENKNVDPVQKALLCQKAEHDFANVPCGIMDQFASVLSQQNSLILLDCRSQEVTYVPFSFSNYSFLVTNSCVKHELGDGAYRQRRSMCENVASKCGVTSLRDLSEASLREKSSLFDQVHFNRALHVINEIKRTQDAFDAVKSNDVTKLGALMTQSHTDLRDLYEVSCVEIDVLVKTALDSPGVVGSRITGGGFGGCCVTLVESSNVDTLIQRMTESFQQFGKKPLFYLATPQGGSQDCTSLLKLAETPPQ